MPTFEEASIRVGGADLANRLWLHPGTEHPDAVDDQGEPYTSSARVPVRERRRLSAAELSVVASAWHWPSSSCIACIPIDPAFIGDMSGPDVRAARNPQADDFHAVGEKLWKALCDRRSVFSLGETQWLGISRRPSGLRTSTFDISMGQRIGLHLDSWDRSPLAARHASRTRLCINLGSGSRSLLFLPFDMRTVTAALAGDPLAHTANIGERFCTRFADAPVLRLDVPPGWAYIAPTENIIHDGCSEPSDMPDLTVAWLGRIGYSVRLAG